MKYRMLIVLFLFISVLFANAQSSKPQRFVALTIDDLPVASIRTDIQTRREITTKLLKHITDAKVPAIGFVNENKLYVKNRRDEAQVDLLRQWLAAGMELGNHTYSHLSLFKVPLEKYKKEEILRGGVVTKELLQEEGRAIRYFRHPFLVTGKDSSTKKNLAVFLKQHGYTIAPVTYDTDDFLFARAFDIAITRRNETMKGILSSAYLPYMESKADYYERQSIKLFGREIKQILLVHANSINAEELGGLIHMLKNRGYQFITLDEALQDKAYQLPDNWTHRFGVSWLRRWALDRGKEYVLPGEPQVPQFVLDAIDNNSN